MRRITGIVSVVLAVFILIANAQPVAAHANLVRSFPPANAILPTSPTQVELWFSEAPEPAFSQIQILDRAGQQVPGVEPVSGDPTDDKLLHASIQPLQPGIYSVVWRTTSAADGHVTAGAFAFVIGADQAPDGGLQLPTLSQSGPPSSPVLPDALARWIGYLGMAFLIGGFAFTPLVLQPALASVKITGMPAPPPTPEARQPFSQASGLSRLIWIGWTSVLVATLLGVVIQAANSAGVDLLRAIGTPIVTLLSGTRYGEVFLGRILLLILVYVLLFFRGSQWWRTEYTLPWWAAGVFVSVFIAFTTSLDSHAASRNDSIFPLLADWLHLVAVGLWAGSLITLLLALRWLRRVEGERFPMVAASLISRFSQIATICIAVIGITGIYRAVMEVVDPANLIDTGYGTTLLFKLGAMVPLLGFGAVNMLLVERRMVRAIRVPDPMSTAVRWYGIIRRTVLGEIVFIAVVFLITGILTNLPPGRDAFAAGRLARAQADDLRIILVANPGEPGFNTFTVYVKDQLGRPVTDAQKVLLRFGMVEHEMGLTEAPLTNLGDGSYSVTGSYVSMLGTWTVQIIVRRDGRDDAQAILNIPLRAPVLDTQTFLTYPLEAVLGIQVVIGGLLFLALLRRRKLLIAALGGFLVSVVGVGIIAIAANNQIIMTRQNPYLPDSDSLRQGRMIYQDRCAACHGLSGRGDGPAGNGLNPPPANLQLHLSANAGHPDGQLFDWISNGISGSAMPPFAGTLTEEQRWHVVNYIRTLADTQ